MPILDITMRVLHILSAIALLGGTIFIVIALLPALRLVDEQFKSSLMEIVKKRFYRISHPAIVLLLITGIYSWMKNIDVYRLSSKQNGPLLQGLLGTKVLLAAIVIVIIFAQTFKVLPGPPARWAKVNLALGLIIVILAGIVRSLHHQVLFIPGG